MTRGTRRALTHTRQVHLSTECTIRTQELRAETSTRQTITALRTWRGVGRVALAHKAARTCLAHRLTHVVLVRTRLAYRRLLAAHWAARAARTHQVGNILRIDRARRTEVSLATQANRQQRSRAGTVEARRAQGTLARRRQSSGRRVRALRTWHRRRAARGTIMTLGTHVVQRGILHRQTSLAHITHTIG